MTLRACCTRQKQRLLGHVRTAAHTVDAKAELDGGIQRPSLDVLNPNQRVRLHVGRSGEAGHDQSVPQQLRPTPATTRLSLPPELLT